MRYVLGLLPAIACGGMMFACARMMLGARRTDTKGDGARTDEINALREEVARLRKERPASGDRVRSIEE